MKKVKDVGVTVLTVKPGSYLRLAVSMNLRALKLILSHRSNTVVVVHFVVTIVLTAPSLLLAKRVVCVIEGIGTAFSGRDGLKKVLKFGISRLSTLSIFMNAYERSEVGRPDDVVLGGVGIDLSKYTPAMPNSVEPDKPINLLFVGRLVRDKGIFDLFSVMRLLQKRGIDFTMNIVGQTYSANSGTLTDYDLQQAQEEFGESLVLHGYLDNLVQLYQNADLFLFLSWHEGFPVCVMEANACGKPVFAYDVPGCNHAITEGINGRLFSPGKVVQVADAIVSGGFSKFDKPCRNYAQKYFDQNIKADELVELITSVAN